MSEEEKKNDVNEIVGKNRKEQTNHLLLLTLDEYNNKNKLTKFSSKSNKRWIYFQPKNNIINFEENKKISEQIKLGHKSDNSIILENWKELQKIIKEKMSLHELMVEKQMQDNSQLKEKFREYYNIKLKCRKEYEIINNLGNERQKEKEYIINDDVERDLLDTCEPIKNFLFLLRNNPEYIVKLKYILNDNKEKINSLVELLCNQFYDNILIPAQNQNNPELGNLIYKLLEDEIITMNSATIDDFLNDNSFIGKFFTVFLRKDEFRLFFGKILKPILITIDNQDDDCLDVSLLNIKAKLNKVEKIKEKANLNSNNKDILNNKEEEEEYFNLLYKDIKKSKVTFKKNIGLDLDKSEMKLKNIDNFYKKDNIQISQNQKEINSKENSSLNSENNSETLKKKSETINKEEINLEYNEELTQDKIISMILKEKNKDLREFFISQLEQINTDPDIFTNNGLKNIITNEYKPNEGKNILNKYKENFVFIKDLIDSLLQELINKINIIPYSLKCICRIIFILITKKFPNLPKFYRNAFIGKFVFDKCIFPILSLDSKNSIINRIFSPCVKSCVNIIINVISNAYRGCLYQANSETEKTIFNYYLIEIIPILNKFYEYLIDIKLPDFIENELNVINEKIKENKDNKIFHFNRRKIPIKSNGIEENNINLINNNIKNNKDINYDYFKENPEEIMRLQGICFSIQDILFLLSIISKNMKVFKNLPEYDFFIKTVERINCDDYKLEELSKTNQNNSKEKELIKQIFYVIFKDERNNQLENLFKSKKKDKSKFYSDDDKIKESGVILNKIKFCIKNILKNIELTFSDLDKVTSTDKLFSALYFYLNEIGENSEIYDRVPIKWYSQYIYENKDNLNFKYRENDFQLLYEEMVEEEREKLEELKNITSKIITKNNINLNCANDLVNKMNYSLEDIIEEKKIAKLEIFIDTEEIKVCLLTSKDKDKEGQKLYIKEISECPFNNSDFHKDPLNTKNKLTCHTRYIKDFINKFSYEKWDKENKLPPPKILVGHEIRSGQRKTKIYKAFQDYKNIIKKRIKAPINNRNLFKDIYDYNDLLEKIEDFIFRQIYKYIAPSLRFKLDETFFKKTQDLDWVTPNMLDIKNISINLLDYPINCIQKLEKVKSVNDKLNCIRDAHAAINNVIKFSNGSDSDAGQDEITPLFQYIIIKAQPKTIYTNIYYIKTLLDESELSGSKGFLITQMESAISYIDKLEPNSLKIKQNEIIGQNNEMK